MKRLLPVVLPLLISEAFAADDATELSKEVTTIRRIFVDRLNGGDQAQHIRDMIIASLDNAKLFIITENVEKADAFLRGSAEDLIFNESHTSSEVVNARTALSLPSSSSSGSSLRRNLGAVSIGENESQHSSERKHEATATVRLVKKDGDVIWSTTQESVGAKLRGASADVAEKITRKLIDDIAKARKQVKPSTE